jgi:hypothetical protein
MKKIGEKDGDWEKTGPHTWRKVSGLHLRMGDVKTEKVTFCKAAKLEIEKIVKSVLAKERKASR